MNWSCEGVIASRHGLDGALAMLQLQCELEEEEGEEVGNAKSGVSGQQGQTLPPA